MASNRNTSRSPSSVRAPSRTPLQMSATTTVLRASGNDPPSNDPQPERPLRHIESAIERLRVIEDAAVQANERLRSLCGRMVGHEPAGESAGTAGSHESSEVEQLHAVISATEAQVSQVVSQIERLERL